MYYYIILIDGCNEYVASETEPLQLENIRMITEDEYVSAIEALSAGDDPIIDAETVNENENENDN